MAPIPGCAVRGVGKIRRRNVIRLHRNPFYEAEGGFQCLVYRNENIISWTVHYNVSGTRE